MKFKTILTILLFNFSASYARTYQCKTSGHKSQCDVKDLNLTKDDHEIVPQAENPADIKTVDLAGVVPFLSSDVISGICETLPKFEWLQASNVSLTEIEENAFDKCGKLTDLFLDHTMLTKINKNAFRGLSKLDRLWLSGGNIPKIDLDLSDLQYLRTMILRGMNISEISNNLFRGLNNLKGFSLESNQLLDLDIKGILTHTPNLESISLFDNNFKCSRVAEILLVLKAKNVRLDGWLNESLMRKRTYTPNTIEGVHCLTDEQWEAEKNKL